MSQSQQLVYTLVGNIRNVVEKLLDFEDIGSIDENLFKEIGSGDYELAQHLLHLESKGKS
jgi:hypothetical protein